MGICRLESVDSNNNGSVNRQLTYTYNAQGVLVEKVFETYRIHLQIIPILGPMIWIAILSCMRLTQGQMVYLMRLLNTSMNVSESR